MCTAGELKKKKHTVTSSIHEVHITARGTEDS